MNKKKRKLIYYHNFEETMNNINILHILEFFHALQNCFRIMISFWKMSIQKLLKCFSLNDNVVTIVLVF